MDRRVFRSPFGVLRRTPLASVRCIAAVLALVLLLPACTPQQKQSLARSVVVQYTLTNRCDLGFIYWHTGDVSPSTVGTAGTTLVYTIDVVGNEQPESTPFTFDPSRLYIDAPSVSRVYTGGPSTLVQIPRSGPIVVAAGTTWNGTEMVVIALDSSPVPSNPVTALRYAYATTQPVMMIGRPRAGGVHHKTDSHCVLPDLPRQTILQ